MTGGRYGAIHAAASVVTPKGGPQKRQVPEEIPTPKSLRLVREPKQPLKAEFSDETRGLPRRASCEVECCTDGDGGDAEALDKSSGFIVLLRSSKADPYYVRFCG
jgi:hypothetical protein